MKYLSGIIFTVLFQLPLGAQPDPHFSPFQGTIYDIPADWLEEGYGPWLPYVDELGQITLDSLAVPETHVYAEYFPGVHYRLRYGIIFTSEMEIDQRGCYEFYLESDDGSILWIADSLIIDNDKPHRMTVKRDSVMLDKGRFPVKVWYYSAYMARFGLIFRSRALPDSLYCLGLRSGTKQLLTFDSNPVFFEFDSDIISPQGRNELDNMCQDLNGRSFSHIYVIGYTDNIGSAEYNEALSLKRAESIAGFMKSKLNKQDISFHVEGRGVFEPPTGQEHSAEQLQRRVEIYIE